MELDDGNIFRKPLPTFDAKSLMVSGEDFPKKPIHWLRWYLVKQTMRSATVPLFTMAGGGKGGTLMARLDNFIVKELSKGGESWEGVPHSWLIWCITLLTVGLMVDMGWCTQRSAIVHHHVPY